MNMIAALSLMFIGGISSGSFALSTKYATKWRFENIWLNYALWAFVIFPWFVMLFLAPKILTIYALTPTNFILILVFGGILFGLGQTSFAAAINMIGMGLAFVINLGLGIVAGFALPLIIEHPEKILTPFGATTIFGIVMAIIGLMISNYAGKLRDRGTEHNKTKNHTLGTLLAAFAGLSSASQNFVFSYTSSIQQAAADAGTDKLGASIIIWPLYLLCGFIPYSLYMLYLHKKNKSFNNYLLPENVKYSFFALTMGICWYGALICYSKAAQLIGALGPMVGWPMFMVLTILASSFWSWKSGEWTSSSQKAKNTMKLGLAFLLLAVIVLGYSASII